MATRFLRRNCFPAVFLSMALALGACKPVLFETGRPAGTTVSEDEFARWSDMEVVRHWPQPGVVPAAAETITDQQGCAWLVDRATGAMYARLDDGAPDCPDGARPGGSIEEPMPKAEARRIVEAGHGYIVRLREGP